MKKLCNEVRVFFKISFLLIFFCNSIYSISFSDGPSYHEESSLQVQPLWNPIYSNMGREDAIRLEAEILYTLQMILDNRNISLREITYSIYNWYSRVPPNGVFGDKAPILHIDEVISSEKVMDGPRIINFTVASGVHAGTRLRVSIYAGFKELGEIYDKNKVKIEVISRPNDTPGGSLAGVSVFSDKFISPEKVPELSNYTIFSSMSGSGEPEVTIAELKYVKDKQYSSDDEEIRKIAAYLKKESKYKEFFRDISFEDSLGAYITEALNKSIMISIIKAKPAASDLFQTISLIKVVKGYSQFAHHQDSIISIDIDAFMVDLIANMDRNFSFLSRVMVHESLHESKLLKKVYEKKLGARGQGQIERIVINTAIEAALSTGDLSDEAAVKNYRNYFIEMGELEKLRKWDSDMAARMEGPSNDEMIYFARMIAEFNTLSRDNVINWYYWFIKTFPKSSKEQRRRWLEYLYEIYTAKYNGDRREQYSLYNFIDEIFVSGMRSFETSNLIKDITPENAAELYKLFINYLPDISDWYRVKALFYIYSVYEHQYKGSLEGMLKVRDFVRMIFLGDLRSEVAGAIDDAFAFIERIDSSPGYSKFVKSMRADGSYLTLEDIAVNMRESALSGDDQKENLYGVNSSLSYVAKVIALVLRNSERGGISSISDKDIHLLKYSVIFANIGGKRLFSLKKIKETLSWLKEIGAINSSVDIDNILSSVGRLGKKENVNTDYAGSGYIFGEDNEFFYGVFARHSAESDDFYFWVNEGVLKEGEPGYRLKQAKIEFVKYELESFKYSNDIASPYRILKDYQIFRIPKDAKGFTAGDGVGKVRFVKRERNKFSRIVFNIGFMAGDMAVFFGAIGDGSNNIDEEYYGGPLETFYPVTMNAGVSGMPTFNGNGDIVGAALRGDNGYHDTAASTHRNTFLRGLPWGVFLTQIPYRYNFADKNGGNAFLDDVISIYGNNLAIRGLIRDYYNGLLTEDDKNSFIGDFRKLISNAGGVMKLASRYNAIGFGEESLTKFSLDMIEIKLKKDIAKRQDRARRQGRAKIQRTTILGKHIFDSIDVNLMKKDYPIDIVIDLSLMPLDDFDRNIETWAYLIAMTHRRGLDNINFIFKYVNRNDRDPREVLVERTAEGKLRGFMAKLFGIDGLDMFFKERINKARDTAIEVNIVPRTWLESYRDNIISSKGSSLPESVRKKYFVAMERSGKWADDEGIVQNFDAALSIAIAQAFLDIAKQRGESRDALVRNLIKLYKYVLKTEKFSPAKAISGIINGSFQDRIDSSILLALPEITKGALNELRYFHDHIHRLQRAA